MATGLDKLAAAVRQRIGSIGAVTIEPDLKRHASVNVTLDSAHFACTPGIMQLQPIKEPRGRHQQYRLPSRASFVFDPTAPIDDVVHTTMLNATNYMLHVKAEMTEPAPQRHSRSMKWKRFPPSRRKRMKSWRWASDYQKLRYAPLAGLSRVPLWAKHPDARRRWPLGNAQVRQRIHVYTQDGAPVDQLLQEHSREWVIKVTQALL
jgi:hypothetical protein